MNSEHFLTIAAELVKAGREFYARGWVLGTSGNLSAVLVHEPLRLAITASGVDKGDLNDQQILEIDREGNAVGAVSGKASDERFLHVEVVTGRGAGAVLHTHSVWSTILSDAHANEGGLGIEGYEMLKGLDGVKTHQHREWLPILENDQDMPALAGRVRAVLQQNPEAHGFLLRRHGLYTWGKSVRDARRHVEILEFLLEATGRLTWQSSEYPTRT